MSALPAEPQPSTVRANGRAPREVARTERRDDSAAAARDQELETIVRRMLELLGEDPGREGLRDTPTRVRKSLQWLTRGYAQSAREAVGTALFEERHGSLVLVRDLDFHSLCEHHMLPFFGRVHVGYVPAGRVVGLSKLARVIDVYARRLQVQERLTEDLAGALEDLLRPEAVGVVVEAQHHCMMMRGVEKQAAHTLTTAWRGTFATDRAARSELLSLLRGAHGPGTRYGLPTG